MNVSLVPVHLIDQTWPLVSAGFERAVAKTGGDVAVGDLWTQARSGRAFLFVAHDEKTIFGASLWRFETWPTGAKFRCLALYGADLVGWFKDMEKAVRAAAGTATLVMEGRRGWPGFPGMPRIRELRTLFEDG